MKEYLSIELNKKQEIIERIKQILVEKEDIVFAFIFGSFLSSTSFRDIDIGIYVNGVDEDKIFDYELMLSRKIAERYILLPFDIFEVKVLNFAKTSFLNNIFSYGKLLFSKDFKLLTNMIENTSLDAISNEYIAYQSLRDLIPT